MAIKKISEFPTSTPASTDRILFEQNERGRCATIEDAVNTCSLSLAEIRASTDLTGKVASAEAVRDSLSVSSYHNDGESIVIKIPPNFVIIITADGSDNHYLGLVAGYVLTTIVSKGYTIDNISISADRGEITLPRHSWYRYMIIK